LGLLFELDRFAWGVVVHGKTENHVELE